MIVFGPRSYYKESELEDIQKYLEEGGNLLVALGEGGNEKNGTNLNDLLMKNYNIGFNDDYVVRTSFYKYLHPKECYIEDTKFHPELEKSILKTSDKKRKMMNNEDLLDNNDQDPSDNHLKVVYPYGCTLKTNEDKKIPSILFTSGLISYPLKRPLLTCFLSKSKRGRSALIGSEHFFDDDFFEKEDNKKIIDTVLKWLLSQSVAQLDKPYKDIDIQEFNFSPSILSISENIKSSLEEVKEPPKNFYELFDNGLFSIDNNMVPEAIGLYTELNVKHDTLGIIPPQFETPLPPLQLAVFDPIIRDFDNPNLELFDLNEQFASEK